MSAVVSAFGREAMSPSAEPNLRLAHRPAEHILLYRKFNESPSKCGGFSEPGCGYAKVGSLK
jgi:hypothetical protein